VQRRKGNKRQTKKIKRKKKNTKTKNGEKGRKMAKN